MWFQPEPDQLISLHFPVFLRALEVPCKCGSSHSGNDRAQKYTHRIFFHQESTARKNQRVKLPGVFLFLPEECVEVWSCGGLSVI